MKPLRALIVEDSEQDAMLLVRQLQRGGYSLAQRIVETAQEMKEALKGQGWDIVLCDYVLPDFGGLEAIKLLREINPDLPLIVISGQIGEDTAVATMKAGAQDYIIKGNLKRLVPAIERELAEAENRKQRKKAENELQQYHTDLERVVEQRTRALADSEAKANALIKYAPTGIYEIDFSTGQFISLNDAVCNLTGYTREELFSLGPSALLDDESKKVFAERIRRNLAGEQIGDAVEYKVRKKDGSIIFVMLNVSFPKEKHNIAFVIGHDVTEQKKMEKIKDEFIGMVSHEIKTPLTVIIGALAVAMSEGVSEEDAKELILDAFKHAEDLANIVENLLELSRYQSNRLNITPQPTNLGEMFQSILRKLGPRSNIHQISVNIPQNMPTVRVDLLRLERVLYNLVENAIKYSPNGGAVIMSAELKDSRAVISITDQGIGIKAENMAKLFNSFERLEAYETYSIPGLGLGLRVCDILVTAHGGKIWVDSEEGKGSTFFFTIPLK